MLNLNLVSQEDKDAFRFMAYRRAVLRIGAVAGAAGVVSVILLLPSFLFLNFQRKEVLRELATEERALQAFGVEDAERRISALNGASKRISALAREERRVSGVLDGLAPLIGSVKLSAVTVNFSAGSVEIDGTAPTRNVLLAFERALEDSAFFRNVSVRLVDLVKLENVVFTLRGALEQTPSPRP